MISLLMNFDECFQCAVTVALNYEQINTSKYEINRSLLVGKNKR